MVISEEPVTGLDELMLKVAERDAHQCAVCGASPARMQFILDPVVFDEPVQGAPSPAQVMSNVILLCDQHAHQAETTELSVKDLRQAAGITAWTVPATFEHDQEYDRYGNPVLTNGQRMKGPWLANERVRRVLEQGGMLSIFTDRVKMPRTFHMPWSEGRSDDDKTLDDMSAFEGREVVLTEKMDGENTCFYHDYLHARSIDGRHHPSRDWIKAFHASIAWQIPETFRIYVENLYARHSVVYEDLKSYCLGFHVWDGFTCLSYDETLAYLEMLGIEPVRELWRGRYCETTIRRIQAELSTDDVEGSVLRVTDAFHYTDFRRSVAKQVRRGHVTTDTHWMHQEIVPNKLKG